MKKALIVTCNDSYDYGTRTKYVEKYLRERYYEVEYLLSDFDHRTKKPYKADRESVIHYLHVPAYSKNLSLGRIWSHIRFARQVKQFIMKNQYDLVYHCAPPNCTIRLLSQCRSRKEFRLVTEIGDMWPESIPIGNTMKKMLSLPFSVWSALRDRHLGNSDVIIAECDLFNHTIQRNMRKASSETGNITTLYFCKQFVGDGRSVSYQPSDAISLCYLGSINNIIDIEMIGKVIQSLASAASVRLEIIGEGERRSKLIETAENAGAQVVFHGVIYDDDKKLEVFNRCHYALNIMKPEVFVGMTMKSLDYFSAGIPIINNICGDVWSMVEVEEIGFNVSDENLPDQIERIVGLSGESYAEMNAAVRKAHERHFSIECFEDKMSQLL